MRAARPLETGADAGDARGRFRRTGWSALVLLGALALRLPALGFGLDFDDPARAVHNIHLDERAMVIEELQLMGGDWHPGDFLMRGTGPFYLAGVVDAALLGSIALAGGEGWNATLDRLETNPSLLFLVHRSLAALCGVLTVLVMMRICRRELGPDHALVAGLVLACAHMHVHVSQLGLVDVPWVLFALLALDRALELVRSPDRSHYLAAGLWIGLAGATKYPGALVGLPVLVAHLMARRAAGRAGRRAPPWSLLAATIGVSIVVFLTLAPRILFRPGEYLLAFRTQAEILDIAERSSAYGYVLYRHLTHSLAIGLGEPVLALAALGLVLALRHGDAQRRIALFGLLLVPTALVAKDPAPRFATGLLVAAVPLAAIGLMGLVQRAPRALQGLALLLALAPSLVRAVGTELVLARPDTRPELVAELSALGLPAKDVLGIGHRGLPQLMGRAMPYVSFLREMRNGRMVVEDVLRSPPAYILRDLSSGVPEEVVWGPFRALVEEEYEEIFRVDGRRKPGDEPPPQGHYLVPRTYVPFATPWDASRPGPGLVLYRRRMPD